MMESRRLRQRSEIAEQSRMRAGLVVDTPRPPGHDAVPKEETATMSPRIVTTILAPAAIGPYSQAVQVGDLLFLSGQIPLDPATGELTADDIAAQTNRVMQNLDAILTAAGASLGSLVKTTIYLTDLADFAVVNRIYGEYFSPPFPARATVEVKALPRGARIEIEGIAVLPSPRSESQE
jgi:2-iminobutanoate/2-iminopropanoate deaminase